MNYETLITVSTELKVQSILKRVLIIKAKRGEPGKRRENIVPGGCVVNTSLILRRSGV